MRLNSSAARGEAAAAPVLLLQPGKAPLLSSTALRAPSTHATHDSHTAASDHSTTQLQQDSPQIAAHSAALTHVRHIAHVAPQRHVRQPGPGAARQPVVVAKAVGGAAEEACSAPGGGFRHTCFSAPRCPSGCTFVYQQGTPHATALLSPHGQHLPVTASPSIIAHIGPACCPAPSQAPTLVHTRHHHITHQPHPQAPNLAAHLADPLCTSGHLMQPTWSPATPQPGTHPCPPCCPTAAPAWPQAPAASAAPESRCWPRPPCWGPPTS